MGNPGLPDPRATPRFANPIVLLTFTGAWPLLLLLLPPPSSSYSLSLSLFFPLSRCVRVPLFPPPSRRVSTLPLSLAQPRRRSKRYFRRQIPPQQRETSYLECFSLPGYFSPLRPRWNTATTAAARHDTASSCPFVLAAASSERGQTEFLLSKCFVDTSRRTPFRVLRTAHRNGSYLAFEGLVLFHLAHVYRRVSISFDTERCKPVYISTGETLRERFRK